MKCSCGIFRKAKAVSRSRYLRTVGLALALASILGGATPAFAARSQQSRRPGDHAKLDRKLNDRDRDVKGGTSRVIIELKPGKDVASDVTALGGRLGRRLSRMNGMVVELPNRI